MRIPHLLFVLFSIVLLLGHPRPAASAAAPSDADRRESPVRRSELEQAFLLRSAEELSRALASANETMAVLKEQTDAAASRGQNIREGERLALLRWYQKYTDWLRGMSSEMDQGVSSYFSRRKPEAGWTARYEELAGGCRKLADELDGSLQKLEKDRRGIEERIKRLNTAVADRRLLVEKDDLELARELWPAYRASYDQREAVYKDLSDEEVLFFLNELRASRERLKYLECLSELGAYERWWLDVKAESFARSGEIAVAIGGADPGAMAYAFRGAIRTAEASLAALKGRSGELDAKMHGIARTGSLVMLERLEELTRYYERMKTRFDREIEWLLAQIGSYQAELTLLGRGR